VFGFFATLKTPRREYLTANESENQLSTNCVDKLTFKSLKRSRYAASPQIGQKLTNLLKPIKPKQLQQRDNPVLIKNSSKKLFSSTIKPTSAKNNAAWFYTANVASQLHRIHTNNSSKALQLFFCYAILRLHSLF
jgi:hypothetical protein